MLAAAGPAAAGPDPDQGFGYNVQSLVRSTQVGQPPKFSPAEWPTYLGLMTRDGIRVARADALWAPAEPNAPSGGQHRYDWSTADGIAGGLAAQGVRWDAVLIGTPKWAGVNGSQFSSPKPQFYGDYAAFAGAFAARYGGGGSFWAEHPEIPPMPVQRFEIWNEPNTEVHWGTTPSAQAFASLFAGAQAAIKAADPGARVSVGGIVWNDDVAYLNGFFTALGPGVAVDGLGSHPYAPTMFGLAANVVRVRKALDELGRASVPLEINELGWPAAYDRTPADRAINGPVSDAARAATLALAADSLTRSTCDVADLVIFDLVEGEDDPQHIESLMGLYRRNGSTTITGAAFADSVARYRAELARPGLPVPVCGPRGAAKTRVLPLDLAANPATGGCAAVTVTYRGNPLEEAQVRLLSPGPATFVTDANGKVLVCRPPHAHAARTLRIAADVPGVAASNQVLCGPAVCAAVGPAAACAITNVAVTGSRRLATILRRGVTLQTRACDPQIGAAVRVRARLVLTRAAARRVGIVARTNVVTIGTGSARLEPGQALRFSSRLTARARRALRGARSVPLTVAVSATESRTMDETTRKVTLTR
jgi:hypothetical protein